MRIVVKVWIIRDIFRGVVLYRTEEKVSVTAMGWVMGTETQKMKEGRIRYWVLASAPQTRTLKLERWLCGTGQGHHIQFYTTAVYVIICVDDAHWMHALYTDVASRGVPDWALFVWTLCSHTTSPGVAMRAVWFFEVGSQVTTWLEAFWREQKETWNPRETGFNVCRSGTLSYKEHFDSQKRVKGLQMERPIAIKT